MSQRRAVVRRVLASRPLRRIELAFLGFSASEHGVWVAMVIYAYQQGGTGEAAAVAVAQLLPAAAVAPLASRIVDRHGGAAGLWLGYVVQALAMGATAVLLLTGAPSLAAYAGAIVAASAVTFTRPAQAAVLPAYVVEPAELTAANAVTGWLESLSVFLGPALAGALIGLEGPGAAFALFAAATTASAVLVTPLARDGRRAAAAVAEAEAESGREGALAALRAQPGALPLLAIFVVQFLTYGAFDVLVVVVAIEVIDIGPSGGGYLNAVFGIGGVLGGIGGLWLVGRHRLVPPLIGAAAVWGTAFALIGAWPTVAGTFLLFAAAGSAWTMLDVSGRTLLQRAMPPGVRGRAFGVLEGLSMLALAAGSALVPLLDALGGPRLAMAAVGVLLIVVTAAMALTLRELDRVAAPVDRQIALLRGSPLFEGLTAPALEGVARALTLVRLPAGAAVVRQGEPGDRFFLIADGTAGVAVDDRPVADLGPGDGFGEIALLRDGIRTSTVTARSPVTLFALERGPFLEAVNTRIAGEGLP